MTRLETIKRLNLASSLIDTISAGSTTWLGIKLFVWSHALSTKVGGNIAKAPVEYEDETLKLIVNIIKAGGVVATALLTVVMWIIGIIVLVIAINLIVPAIFGFISMRRARKCEDPFKSVKIIRTADIVRIIFHTFLMIGAVIVVIIAIYNGAFGFAIIAAVLVSTLPFVFSILSLVWQKKMKGATVNADQDNMV
ncbi:MAG: hypothetical protein J5777_02860 [Clostridiales bacterium]|nr:hypothetical protein [Clostridiales bacterium]